MSRAHGQKSDCTVLILVLQNSCNFYHAFKHVYSMLKYFPYHRLASRSWTEFTFSLVFAEMCKTVYFNRAQGYYSIQFGHVCDLFSGDHLCKQKWFHWETFSPGEICTKLRRAHPKTQSIFFLCLLLAKPSRKWGSSWKIDPL